MKKVNISYACPVKWDSMQSLDDKTNFCSSCKMKVQDFTKDSELNTAGVYCGRFRMDQVESINRTFNFNPKQVFVVSLISLLGMAAPLAAQNTNNPAPSDSITNVSKELLKLKGVVKDKNTSEGIPFVNVIIKNGEGAIIAGSTTDFDGNFSLEILRSYIEEGGYSLNISVLGYKSPKPQNLSEVDLETTLEIMLKEANIELMGVWGPYIPNVPNGTTLFDKDDIQESPYRQ